ncbi:MAG: hypothetical protein J7L26_12030 [Candidatus Aminicenantes bacterium]|nr:hypothetical protein [Candidatus Aminicenantes bacterium]
MALNQLQARFLDNRCPPGKTVTWAILLGTIISEALRIPGQVTMASQTTTWRIPQGINFLASGERRNYPFHCLLLFEGLWQLFLF